MKLIGRVQATTEKALMIQAVPVVDGHEIAVKFWIPRSALQEEITLLEGTTKTAFVVVADHILSSNVMKAVENRLLTVSTPVSETLLGRIRSLNPPLITYFAPMDGFSANNFLSEEESRLKMEEFEDSEPDVTQPVFVGDLGKPVDGDLFLNHSDLVDRGLISDDCVVSSYTSEDVTEMLSDKEINQMLLRLDGALEFSSYAVRRSGKSPHKLHALAMAGCLDEFHLGIHRLYRRKQIDSLITSPKEI